MNPLIEKARKAADKPVKNLLSVGADAKTVKSLKLNHLIGILYLAPSRVSGYEVCPAATKGCRAACLFTAGQGRFSNVKVGRIRKTLQFMERQAEFMSVLVADIRKLVADAETADLTPAVRLNGTSDIAWETIPVTVDGVDYPNIMAVFPNVQFYDYTKRFERLGNTPDNYHLTFSRAETAKSHLQAMNALRAGFSITVVFRDKLPETWAGFEVLDGDESDSRFIQDIGKPVVFGLKAKGQASKDTTGFVVD